MPLSSLLTTFWGKLPDLMSEDFTAAKNSWPEMCEITARLGELYTPEPRPSWHQKKTQGPQKGVAAARVSN